jgi:alpha,alpha-trehalase
MAVLQSAIVAATLCATAATALFNNGSVIAPCDSPIYCLGDILKEIQLAHPFSDSKTFVDMSVPPVRPAVSYTTHLHMPQAGDQAAQ